MKYILRFQLHDNNLWTIEANLVKFGSELHHKHAYKLHTKCIYRFHNYNYGDSANLWVCVSTNLVEIL